MKIKVISKGKVYDSDYVRVVVEVVVEKGELMPGKYVVDSGIGAWDYFLVGYNDNITSYFAILEFKCTGEKQMEEMDLRVFNQYGEKVAVEEKHGVPPFYGCMMCARQFSCQLQNEFAEVRNELKQKHPDFAIYCKRVITIGADSSEG